MENTPLNPFDKLINFLKGNHTWTRIYKPNELTDPITKAIADNGKKFEDAFSKIASLKGEKGDPGKDGLPGKDGNDGKTPVKGKDYFDGKDGYTPKKGFDYFDGKDGVDGKNGKDGKDGKTPVKGRDYFTKEELNSIEDSVSSKVQIAKQTVYSLWQRAIGIKNLDDVELSNPTNGQGLVYNATKNVWENSSAGGGGGSVDSVVAGNNIDVDATDPANPIVSVETLTLADISDVTASATEVNYTDGVTSAIQTQLNAKQATLVSATNIKTINSTSLLGAGDIVIAGGSGISRAIVSSSGSFTAGATAATDYVYLITGAHAVALPTAVSNTNRYTFKNNHSAAITITPNGAETLEGAASIQIAPEDAVDIISNNSNWFII